MTSTFAPSRPALAPFSPAPSPVAPAPSWPLRPALACAWSEVFDKLTILRLKRDRLTDPARQTNVTRELAEVEEVAGDLSRFPPALEDAVRELGEVNGLLWDIEDATRACERAGDFGERFVALARSVYRENDRRARIKKRIDVLLRSALVGEKSHPAAG